MVKIFARFKKLTYLCSVKQSNTAILPQHKHKFSTVMTTSINAKKLSAAFGNFNRSYAAAIRFIFEKAGETEAELPAAPTRGDNSPEAKALKEAIKAANDNNAVIAACKAIVSAFNITAKDMKSNKTESELRGRIVPFIPYKSTEGVAVTFAPLPAYLKKAVDSTAKDYMIVVPATWIETIALAAGNVEANNPAKTYTVTLAPDVEEGIITDGASGDIVDKNGETVDTRKVFAVWESEAIIRNISGAAGRAARQAAEATERAKKQS